MADRRISDLTAASSVENDDLFVLEQLGAAKKLTGHTLELWLLEMAEGHGGVVSFILHSTTGTNPVVKTYRMTFADDTYYDISISDGVKGDTGAQTYVWIKYADQNPTADNQIRDAVGPWMGIYTGTATTAPTTRTSYKWYQIKGAKGDTGVSIESVSLYSTSGLVDTYRVVFDNNTYTTFQVTNGSSISSITKTATQDLVDTYTVSLTDGSTTTFTVTNAKSIVSIVQTSGTHAAGSSDVYRITFNDGDVFDFSVYNGANGLGSVSTVSGIQADGNGDVPQVVFGNGAPTTATVGQEKQLYFDSNTGSMYICFGQSGGTYVWMGATVTIDNTFSTTSENAVQNKVITGKVGTASLNTTAQNLSGAINEHESDISGLSTKVGSAALNTTAADLSGAVNEINAYLPLHVSWTLSSSALTYSNAAITADMRVVSMQFGTPSNVRTRPTWTTANGSVSISATVVDTTTIDLILQKTK